MSGKIIDSNIVIGLFRNDQRAINALRKISIVYMPVIVLGELFYGANVSDQTALRIKQIQDFQKNVRLLSCDEKTAENYGKIKSQLKKAGTPIPENDIWIAALAKQHSLPLLTNDKHFLQVKSIQKESLS